MTDILFGKKILIDALEQMKANDIVFIDINEHASIADAMIVASGTSSRHIQSIADKVTTSAKHQGYAPIGIEGEKDSEWVLIDFNDIIVHIMMPDARHLYDLEKLWQISPNQAANQD